MVCVLGPQPSSSFGVCSTFLAGLHDRPRAFAPENAGFLRTLVCLKEKPRATGLELGWVRQLKSPVSTIISTHNSAFGSAPLGGFALPFQICRLPGRRGTE